MSAPSTSNPIIHSVQFYDHDDALIQRLCGILVSAVDIGNAIIVVATDEHRQQLKAALGPAGINCDGLEADGRLQLLNARALLDRSMVDGLPSRTQFFSTVEPIVRAAKLTSWNLERGLTIFCEMVALVWHDGNHTAALELEELWNELLGSGSFHLHCAYPRHFIAAGGDSQLLRSICERHSHVFGRVD